MLRGEIVTTPDEPKPYAVRVWQGGDLARAKPADSPQEAQAVLMKLLEGLREA
jgi:hypothetical protein